MPLCASAGKVVEKVTNDHIPPKGSNSRLMWTAASDMAVKTPARAAMRSVVHARLDKWVQDACLYGRTPAGASSSLYDPSRPRWSLDRLSSKILALAKQCPHHVRKKRENLSCGTAYCTRVQTPRCPPFGHGCGRSARRSASTQAVGQMSSLIRQQTSATFLACPLASGIGNSQHLAERSKWRDSTNLTSWGRQLPFSYMTGEVGRVDQRYRTSRPASIAAGQGRRRRHEKIEAGRLTLRSGDWERYPWFSAHWKPRCTLPAPGCA